MTMLNEHYVVDADGNRVGVFLDIATYERLLDAFEELEDIHDAEEALAALESGQEEAIPLAQAIAEYEHQDATKKVNPEEQQG